jgi:hypothetical protein
MSYLNLVAQPTERRWSWWGRVIKPMSFTKNGTAPVPFGIEGFVKQFLRVLSLGARDRVNPRIFPAWFQ